MQAIRSKQWITFFAIVLGSMAIAAGPGRYLLDFAYHTGDQSYILLIPVLSAMLVYRDSQSILAKITPAGPSRAATVAFVPGLVLIATAYGMPAGSEWQMAVTGLG